MPEKESHSFPPNTNTIPVDAEVHLGDYSLQKIFNCAFDQITTENVKERQAISIVKQLLGLDNGNEACVGIRIREDTDHFDVWETHSLDILDGASAVINRDDFLSYELAYTGSSSDVRLNSAMDKDLGTILSSVVGHNLSQRDAEIFKAHLTTAINQVK